MLRAKHPTAVAPKGPDAGGAAGDGRRRGRLEPVGVPAAT